jgi:uncharacterized protein YuzE
MSVTIAGTTFAHHEYDAHGDVLYLTVDGYEGPPASAASTPEGHGIEYDADGQVVAMTLVNVRWLLDRDGELTLSMPVRHVKADELAEALASA